MIIFRYEKVRKYYKISKKSNLLLETRSSIVNLANDGRSTRHIQKLLKILQPTLSDTMHWCKFTGSNKDRKRRGCPCKTSKTDGKYHVN